MLQAHSFLWHYLWLGPHVLQLVLVVLLIKRRQHKLFPIFLAYLIFEAVEEFTLYTMDVLPSVSSEAFWQAFCVGLVIEGLLKFRVIGELFSHLVGPWPAVSRLGSRLITGTGALLALGSALAAAYAPIDNPQFVIVSRAHVLQQGLYIIESGLILFLFLFAWYLRLTWSRKAFGILLGFGIASCEHLASWAVTANGLMANQRDILDFTNSATYHLCVLIWFYYLLTSEDKTATPPVSLPPHNLDLWNRELERLLQQ